ncbi:MAG TPA: sigma 54-interacting transcriptional regulator [Candidatus Polarisedimenticolaceae bacterium]|nr:sigma 54-interacting transcriptional regulator [Candidatus Polarisedimenticolaceae bacterium]
MADSELDAILDPARLDALRRTCLLDSPPEAAFDRLTSLATTLLHVPVAYVSLVDDHRQFFKSQRGLAEPLALARETPLSHSFCKHAVESRRPLLVEDAREHPILKANPAVVAHGIIAYAGIPLITSEGHALGSFCVVDHAPRRWTDGEVALLEVLAASTLSEIELRRLAGELSGVSAGLKTLVEARTERLRVLLDVNNAVVTCLDRNSLFEAAAAALARVIPFDRAALVLRDPVRDVFTVLGVAGTVPTPPIIPLGTEWPHAGSRAGWIVDHGKPLLTDDLRKPPVFFEHERLVQEGILSAVSVPLAVKGKIIGTLNAGSKTRGRYTEADASLLFAIGEQIALALENLLAYEQIAALKARLEEEKLYLQEEAKAESSFGDVVGASRAIAGVLAGVRKVAETDSTVLVTGETGTGKEMIVRVLHEASRRSEKILVKVNCAALPAGVIESELFGHEKGAFTGALQRKLGRFELAHGGTLFLDEIGDLPLDLQAKLLRVLQDGEFERVGGTRTIKVDVRLVAATNRDLDLAVAEGKFRADLFYRLDVFPIHIPPLRERMDDVPRLARHFVMLYAAKMGKTVGAPSDAVLARLTAYRWPGNVRELQNVIERAVILSSRGRIEPGDIAIAAAVAPASRRPRTLEDVERDHVLSVLEETGWRVSGERGAAKILGLKRTTLEGRMQRLGIVRKTAAARDIRRA